MDNFNKGDDGYDPNFSIDNSNSEKLDMYGVWLKQRKDMVEPDSSEDVELFGEDDSDDAMHFDDDFSFSDSFSDIDDMDNINSEVPELDELKMDDDTEPEVIPLESTSSYSSNDDASDIALDEDSFESLDLDDFLSDDSPAESNHEEGADPAEEEPIDLDFTDDAEEVPAAEEDEEPPAGLENFSEISLEDFEDADHGDGSLEVVEDFDDILADDDAGKSSNTEKRSDSSTIDLSVTVDDDADKLQSFTDVSSQVVENNADIPIFGGEEKSDTAAGDAAFFDDVEAVQKDLLSPQQSDAHAAPAAESAAASVPADPVHSAVADDKATALLMKIADEISDLRAELNSLKAGFAAHTNVGAAENSPVQEEPVAETESSGFFSDDDTDETISLTGDELNNILITADFTEEKNTEEDEAVEPVSEDYEIPPVLTKDIVPEIDETDEASVTSDAEFEASITEHSKDSIADAAAVEGEKALAADPVFNVEAAPITSLPEDLSYLDDDQSADSTGAEVTEGVIAQGEAADRKEALKADEDQFSQEDADIESFDIPSEQEIILPEAESASIDTEAAPTIHELQADEDFANPFEDPASIPELEDELIEEPFEADPIVPSKVFEETKVEDQPDDIDELSELEEAIEEPELEVTKQDTLLQAATRKREQTVSMPLELKNEIKSVLAYMDQLLEALPEQKIEEFAKSEYFETYKHLFEELGIS